MITGRKYINKYNVMEQEDYSKIYEYESMGKEYAGEKTIISLT